MAQRGNVSYKGVVEANDWPGTVIQEDQGHAIELVSLLRLCILLLSERTRARVTHRNEGAFGVVLYQTCRDSECQFWKLAHRPRPPDLLSLLDQHPA